MSSFKRKVPQSDHKPLLGTKTSPSLSSTLLTSTGIPSLDDILGGGIQLGTDLLVLNPDPHSAHSDLIQKHFIAQGIASGHDVHVLSPCARDLVESCMWSGSSTVGKPLAACEEPEVAGGGEDKVKIAWRYERMQKFKTTITPNSQEDYCQTFDLTCQIPIAVINANLTSGRLHLVQDIYQTDNDPCDAVYKHIEGVLEAAAQSSSQNVIRISIPSFANPIWGDVRFCDVARFLLRLRLLLRQNPLACAFLTFSSVLSDHPSDWIERLGWSTDACLSLNSFTSDPSMAAMFPSHHGLLVIHNLPRVRILVPASDRFSTLRGLSTPSSSITSGGVGENNLAYKCTRRRLIFETFHLDVEGGVGERRTTPATSVSQLGEVSLPTASSNMNPEDGRSLAAVRVSVESIDTPLQIDREPPNVPDKKQDVPKKPKKRVGFQVDRPDLYDF